MKKLSNLVPDIYKILDSLTEGKELKISEEMYEEEIQEKIRILVSKDENVSDFTRDLARLLISEPLIYEEIWKYLRD